MGLKSHTSMSLVSSKYSSMKKILIVLLVALLCGCGGGGGGGSDSACSDLNVKVYGGDQCSYTQSPVIPLYALRADGSILGTCSGTLVTIDDVLTAAHCIELTRIPGSIGVFAYAGEKLIAIAKGSNHPSYRGSVGSPFDIAMVTLAEPVNIPPVPLLLSNNTAVGEEVTAFGYGLNEKPKNSPKDFRAAHMTISEMWPGGFAASFDAEGTSICQGDSGGPVTQALNGQTGIVGVASFTSNGCTKGSFSGFVDIQYQAIYSFILGYAPDVSVI